MVRLTKKGEQKWHSVHRLVADAFIGVPDQKREINHKDGHKTNNNPQNLEWVTPVENVGHAYRLGLMPNRKGAGNPRSRINEADVPVIRKLHESMSYSTIARRYEVCKATIQAICERRSWPHVA